MNPVKASLRYPQVTLLLTAAVVAAGVYSLAGMPRREDPKITIRSGLVVAVYPGATAEQVELQVTRKIEDRLFRFDEVRKEQDVFDQPQQPGSVVINVYLEDWVAPAGQVLVQAAPRHERTEAVRELPDRAFRVRPCVNSDFGDTVAHPGGPAQRHRYGYRDLEAVRPNGSKIELRTIRAVSKLKRYRRAEGSRSGMTSSHRERFRSTGSRPLKDHPGVAKARNIGRNTAAKSPNDRRFGEVQPWRLRAGCSRPRTRSNA